MLALDDTTPIGELGYRVRVIGDSRPLANGTFDRVAERGVLEFELVHGVELDFELGIAAIDKSGNVGPEAIVPVGVDPDGGCRTGRDTAGTFALGLATLALLARRRR